MGSILTEVVPRKARLVIYLLVSLALLGVSAWQFAAGDPLLFTVSLLGSLTNILAAGNVTPATPEQEE